MLLKLIIVFISGLVIGSVAEFIYKSVERHKLIRPRLVNVQMYAATAVFLWFLHFYGLALIYQVLLIIVFTTGMELAVAVYLLKHNLKLDWDYSGCWLNYKGLICFKFSLLWLLLSLLVYYTLIPLVINLHI
ncbi:MAG: hypothetical protein WC621_02205 [Patescibacteria group bacterium]